MLYQDEQKHDPTPYPWRTDFTLRPLPIPY